MSGEPSVTPSDAVVRDAVLAGVPALASIRHTAAVHRDRIRDAAGTCLRYLVIEVRGRLAGCGCLVLAQPPTWPKVLHLRQMIDLSIEEEQRGRGLGTLLIVTMERMILAAGHPFAYVGVDPRDNPRSLSLYTRLGYRPIDDQPVEDRWEFVDSDGVRHSGVEWIIHLKKRLAAGTGAHGD
jgi:GNAT superfamily N-acetyltransferase